MFVMCVLYVNVAKKKKKVMLQVGNSLKQPFKLSTN